MGSGTGKDGKPVQYLIVDGLFLKCVFLLECVLSLGDVGDGQGWEAGQVSDSGHGGYWCARYQQPGPHIVGLFYAYSRSILPL